MSFCNPLLSRLHPLADNAKTKKVSVTHGNRSLIGWTGINSLVYTCPFYKGPIKATIWFLLLNSFLLDGPLWKGTRYTPQFCSSWKWTYQCIPLQNGLFFDWPQRQRA